MSESIDCLELVDVVTDYLDDALSADHAARIAEHLATCEDCAAALAQFRFTVSIAGQLAADDVAGLDPTTRSALLDIFRNREG